MYGTERRLTTMRTGSRGPGQSFLAGSLLFDQAGESRVGGRPGWAGRGREAHRIDVAEVSEGRRLRIHAGWSGGTRRYGSNVVNIDVEPLAGVDLVGAAEQLPLVDDSCDAAILQAVFEHVRSADLTLRELYRVLRPGAALFIKVPFMQGYHPSPGDYRRYTEQGLRAELADRGFDVEASGVAVGPASAMAGSRPSF